MNTFIMHKLQSSTIRSYHFVRDFNFEHLYLKTTHNSGTNITFLITKTVQSLQYGTWEAILSECNQFYVTNTKPNESIFITNIL
jgi:hypothetical protein